MLYSCSYLRNIYFEVWVSLWLWQKSRIPPHLAVYKTSPGLTPATFSHIGKLQTHCSRSAGLVTRWRQYYFTSCQSVRVYRQNALVDAHRLGLNQLLSIRSATAFCSGGSATSSVCLAHCFAGCSRTSQIITNTSSLAVTARRMFTARGCSTWLRPLPDFVQSTYHQSISSLPTTALNTTSMLTIRSCSWPCGHWLFVPVCRCLRFAPATSNAGLPRKTVCSTPTSLEVMMIGTLAQLRASSAVIAVAVADANLTLSPKLKSFGVILDSRLSLDTHVAVVCTTCHYHIWALQYIWRLLPLDEVWTLACFIVGTGLHYCNSVLYSALISSTQKLQRV